MYSTSNTSVQVGESSSSESFTNVPKTAGLPQRSKAGCQQCRKRKRKCDEQHPQCSACLERALPCDWERKESTRRCIRRQYQYNKQLAVPQQMTPLTTIFVTSSGPSVEKLVSHFHTNSPLWLTTGGSQKRDAWLSLIMPSITRSGLVLNCVLAVAAGDLNKYQPASSDLGNLSSAYYGQAVEEVRSAINEEHRHFDLPYSSTQADDLLLAIILLCVHEIVNFTAADRILPHISAAAALCYNRSFSTAPDSRIRGLLFEIFCYIFTLTAFSHGRSLQLPLASQIFNSPFLSGCQYQGILVGPALPIFHSILRVSIITNDAALTSTLGAAAKTELRNIEEQLDCWDVTQLHNSGTATVDEVITTELYRLACLINVKKMLSYDQEHATQMIQKLLAQFITNLNALPATSPANGVLCWPLVVAGLSAVVATHRALIVGRLRKIHETWRSDIVSRSADFLTKNWRERKQFKGSHVECGDFSSGSEAQTRHRVDRFFTVELPVILV